LELTKRLVQLSGIPAHAAIADLGCGEGIVCEFLHRNGFDPTGVDLSKHFNNSNGIKFIQADFLDLPLISNSFDAVMMECVLSIQNDLSTGLSEARRILKQSGLLLLSDLYLHSDQDSDCNLITMNQYLEIIRKMGFQIIQWEDHTRELRDLIFKILWEQDSIEPCCFPNGQHGMKGSRNLGYFILIGRKNAHTYG